MRTTTMLLYTVLLWMTVGLTACTSQPLTTPPATAVPPAATPEIAYLAPEIALPALVAAERRASIDSDLATLAQLWADDARIIDGRNSATPADDYRWQGRAAILDRYLVAVFPNPPPPATFDALEIEVLGDAAVGENGGDRWRFIYADERWWLAELIYQQPE